MRVLKFGGSSVASAESISKVASIIEAKAKEQKLVVVVSALGGVTDKLLECGKLASEGNEKYKDVLRELEDRHLEEVRNLIPVQDQSGVLGNVKQILNELEELCEGIFLIKELSKKTQDLVVSHGERISSFVITQKLITMGIDAERIDSRELIRTNDNFGNAEVDFKVTDQQVGNRFKKAKQVSLLPGFIASTEEGLTSTLGRGGSDYTAAIIASALNAEILEIWTDVSGMLTADPRLVKQATPIKEISYQEAMELSHFGAKVIYPPTVQPALQKNIEILIKNTFEPEAAGTLITTNTSEGSNAVKGITSINNIALISLEGSGMIGIPGFSARLFGALAQAEINVVLITQGSSEHSITVGIEESDTVLAKKVVEKEFIYEISLKKVEPLMIEKGLSIIALVGDQMRSFQGISGKMFSGLGSNNVNVRAIAQGSSEKNISAVIESKDVEKALNVLHEKLFQTQEKQVNLFIIGIGNVGGELLSQINQQQKYLSEELGINVRVIGLANSKKMLFGEGGIDLNKWKEQLDANGEAMTQESFVDRISSINKRNSVFVDNTANEGISKLYAQLLSQSVSVVTCNKIACSSSYENYKQLKKLARKYNADFLFETNVGAGLPIISTLNDLIKSGDRIRKMKAVLSGSLNFIFNNFKEGVTFHDIVKQAQEEGYTEPDPRIDLSGVDVMRKILILARESGVEMELEDITSVPFMPEDCLKTNTVDDFYAKLNEHSSTFDQIRKDAEAKGEKLKVVASFDEGKAQVGLETVASDHPFFNLDGKDNIVLFTTDRYLEQPLIVKGAGAGAAVTASGIFADIIKSAKD